MKRLWTSLMLVSLISSVTWAQAQKVLLVSDIDDTIKVSHVLNPFGKIARAVDVTTPFLGMSQLYQLIVNQNPTSTKVVYISNAPEELAGIPAASITHQLFLDYNHFPKGELILREDLRDMTHKIRALRELIEKEMPDVLILVGDNGEKDVDVYLQATQEYAYLRDMKVVTFIHQLYSSSGLVLLPDRLQAVGQKLYANQIGYVTPVEIALKLNELGLLAEDKLDWMVSSIAPLIVQEDRVKWDGLAPIAFPFFQDCSDFSWSFSHPASLNQLIQRIERECN